MSLNSERLWTKDFIIISGVNFFTHIVFYMMMVITAIYTMTVFDAGQGAAGLATGVFVLASLAARIFTGKYMDIIGYKPMLVLGVALFTISMALHLFINSLAMVFLLRIIQGAAHGMTTTTAGAVAADIIPDKRRGEGTGYYATAMNVAMAVGPFLSIYLYSYSSFEIIFMTGLFFMLFDLALALFLKVPGRPKAANRRKGWAVGDFVEPKAVPISMVMFLITVAYASLMSFLSPYAEEIQLVEAASFFFMVYAAALLATRPFTGKWFDLYGAKKVSYPFIFLLAGGFVLLSAAKTAVSFLLSAALIGIGFGTILSYFQAIAVQKSPSDKKGLATSTFFIFLDLANGIGAYAIGLLVSAVSFRMVYLICAVVILSGALVFYYVYGKKRSAAASDGQLTVTEKLAEPVRSNFFEKE